MPSGETWNQSGLGEIVFGLGEIVAMGPYANCFVRRQLIIVVFMLCLRVGSFFDLVEDAVVHGPSRI
jgi:hypothetical protein